MSGSSADFFSLTLPDGSIAVTTIAGHLSTGVNVVRSSAANFNGPHLIVRNGSTSDIFRSGIRVEHGNVTVAGTSVNGNTGPGITADESSSVNVLANAVIRGNTEDGVRLAVQSNGGFFQPISIAGNGGASIACDTTSVAFGDFSGIKNVNCSHLASGVSDSATKRRLVMH